MPMAPKIRITSIKGKKERINLPRRRSFAIVTNESEVGVSQPCRQ
jgi:hypothetical protein